MEINPEWTPEQLQSAEKRHETERKKWLRLELALVIAEATGRRLGSIRQAAWPDIDFNGETIRWRADTDKKGREWAIGLSLHSRRSRGVGGAAVWIAARYGRSWWHVAAHKALNIALPGRYFESLGVPRLCSR